MNQICFGCFIELLVGKNRFLKKLTFSCKKFKKCFFFAVEHTWLVKYLRDPIVIESHHLLKTALIWRNRLRCVLVQQPAIFALTSALVSANLTTRFQYFSSFKFFCWAKLLSFATHRIFLRPELSDSSTNFWIKITPPPPPPRKKDKGEILHPSFTSN